MPKILDDTRDPMKLKLGQELRKMQKEDPKALASFLSELSEEEANEILYDQEIWCREQQWIDLSDGVPITMLLAGRGFGKQICVENQVLTVNSGFKRLGDLEVGEEIFDEEGNPTKILAVYDGIPEKAYRIHFSDSTYIDACSDHQWTTWEHADRKQYLRQPENKGAHQMPENWPKWSMPRRGKDTEDFGPKVRTTQEIVDTFWHSSRKDRNHSIPVTKPLQMSERPVPFDPYLYGYWLGDGTHVASVFTCDPKDQDSLIKEINRAGYEIGNNNCYKSVSVLGMLPDLRATNSFRNKKINEDYLYNSFDNRVAFLQGLMDSDGYCEPTGKHVEFCSMTKGHAEAVYFLASSIGAKPVWTEGRAMLDGRDYGTKYRIFWNPIPTANPFRLERKASRVKFPESQGFRNCHRMLTHFEEIESKPMRCLSVDSPNNLFLVGKNLIPTHNTYTSATTVKRAVEKHDVKDILILAPTARDFRSTIAPSIIDLYPPKHENKPYWSPSKASVIWPNGAVAVCIPGEAGSDAPRGLNSAVVIVDELIRMDEEIVTQALLTLRIEPSKMVIATTPKAHPMVIDLVERSQDPDNGYVKLITGSTYENIDNLSSAFSDTVIKKYEGTRLGEQELEGKLILTNDAALWQYETITRNTITYDDVPELVKIAIGVDPAMMARSTAKGKRSPDKTGVVVVALGVDDKLYALEGHTGSYTAEGWVEKVAGLYDKYSQQYETKIVAEINIIGAEMLKMAFSKGGKDYLTHKIKPVFATQSKLQRASPFALLSEQNKVKFVEGEYLKLLSMECTTFTGASGEKSPDSLDAFIWACSELKPAKKSFTKSYELLI